MILREVTIGRSKDCDIYLDPRCEFASSYHATIYMDGTQLMYKDCSRNGTLINNVSVHNRAVPIKYGDVIMLAGRYQLSWNQIYPFFAQYGQQQASVQQPKYATTNMQSPLALEPAVDTSKWNWGAFGIYPIWGFFNGCWWAFLVSMFLGFLFPIPNIVFGIYGTKWAWENKTWTSVDEFERSKKSWDTAGIVITCINVVFFVFFFMFYLSLLGKIL